MKDDESEMNTEIKGKCINTRSGKKNKENES